MNDAIRTTWVLVGIGVAHTITFGALAFAAASDPHRFAPDHAPAVIAEANPPQRLTWRHG